MGGLCCSPRPVTAQGLGAALWVQTLGCRHAEELNGARWGAPGLRSRVSDGEVRVGTALPPGEGRLQQGVRGHLRARCDESTASRLYTRAEWVALGWQFWQEPGEMAFARTRGGPGTWGVCGSFLREGEGQLARRFSENVKTPKGSSAGRVPSQVKVTQPSPALCDSTDCGPPGSFAPGDSPGNDTGVGCLSLLRGIFRKGIEPGYPALHANRLPLSHQVSPELRLHSDC